MIEVILVAIFVACINKLNIVPTLLSLPMIPIYLGFLFYIFIVTLNMLQIKNRLEKYGIILWILTTMPVIYFVFSYRLYYLLIISIILFIIGVILNQIVLKANGNKMPVFPNLTYCTKVFTKEKVDVSETHTLGTENTRLIPLSDIFDVGYNVFSIGDFLIFSGYGIIIFHVIKILQ
jgi:hypothetical protein